MIVENEKFSESAFLNRPAGAPLAALAGGNLAHHFHSWTGASGRRYICSIFPLREAAGKPACPEFDEALLIAVRRLADGTPKMLFVAESDAFSMLAPSRSLARRAAALGASEWHVHLLAESPRERRAAILDLRRQLDCGG
jgi:hypothetical protein